MSAITIERAIEIADRMCSHPALVSNADILRNVFDLDVDLQLFIDGQTFRHRPYAEAARTLGITRQGVKQRVDEIISRVKKARQ